ncbi:MAG: adenylate/guanylate cyclase domain-containing protein, partial [Calditrichae bacterium]|nr:adenylate/guanylate cyclase domain-containing protein [Calditrichia bacterium]NIW79730.1 adenylate/guanylate cyclase domain-containing protein [Calditrichia bacterium]
QKAANGLAGRKSIAVLPFTAITKSEEDEIFKEGIHDDIITQLAKIKDLKVIARTSVTRYKNTEKRAREIGQDLGVNALLEGSVRRSGDRIRIVAQLIDAENEEHLWAETFDRNYSDIFKVQSDVAQQIAIALKATLTPEERHLIQQKPTKNMEAYDYFLKGNHYWS